MKDNQGFTLIELIIVMIIMTILAGGAMLGVNTLFTGSAQTSMERVKAMLNLVRTENMSKEKNYFLSIEEDQGKYYLLKRIKDNTPEALEETVSRVALDLRQGEISYWDETMNEGEAPILVHRDPVPGRNTSPQLTVCFSKDSGNFIAYREHPSDVPTPIVTAIQIEAMGRSYVIHLVKETGKYYVE